MIKLSLLTIAVAAVFALPGCRDTDFVYRRTDVHNPVAVKFDHSVHEMVGNLDLDLLWVIDNSGSMGAYQDEVISSTEMFMNEFVKVPGLRWRMGLLSSDRGDDPYVGFDKNDRLQWDTPKPIPIFQKAVESLGTFGDGNEEFFDRVTDNLKDYPDFVRPQAHLVMISVTDGDESSTQDAQDFFKALTMIKGDENLFTLFGVYGASDLACKPAFGEGPWNFKGSDREKFIQRTGGKYYDICDKDFGNNLQQIFRAAVKRVVLPKVFLKSRPIVSTIQVKYRDTVLAPRLEESGGSWFYDPEINALIFHNLDFAKYDNDSVTVTYTEDDGYQPL